MAPIVDQSARMRFLMHNRSAAQYDIERNLVHQMGWCVINLRFMEHTSSPFFL